MNRILLLDQNSQLGKELHHSLAFFGEIIKTDVCLHNPYNPKEIRDLITNLHPTLIVNALDWHDVDQLEHCQQLAYTINRDIPAILAEEADRQGLPLIHYSTDYVFDGLKDRAYIETDHTNPLNVYGKSKLEAEQAIQSTGCSYIIFRTSSIYDLCGKGFTTSVLRWARYSESLIKDDPTCRTNLIGFSYWASEKDTLRIVDDRTSSPTWVRVLAELTSLALMKAITHGSDWLSSKRGLYHLAGSGEASRLEWAQTILSSYAKAQKVYCSKILPVKSSDFPTPAQRPSYTPLDSTLFESTFGLNIPAWQEVVDRAIATNLCHEESHRQQQGAQYFEPLNHRIELNCNLQEKDRQLTESNLNRQSRLSVAIQNLIVRIVPPNGKTESVLNIGNQILATHKQGGVKSLIKKTKARLTKRNNYQVWIDNNEPTKKELMFQIQSSRKWKHRPLVSIILIVSSSSFEGLADTIRSVTEQTYENWELWVVNGSSGNIYTQKLINKYTSKDARIKVAYFDNNVITAENTNSVISGSSGEFVGFLTQGDLLAPFALFETLVIFLENSQVDIVYTDQDKIAKNGKDRYEPFFKPGFNLDYLRSTNYILNFFLITRQIGTKVGWFQSTYDQPDYFDLILKVTEIARYIAHCPKILYHQRDSAGLNSIESFQQDCRIGSGVKALQDHLERMCIKGKITQSAKQPTYRVSYNFDTSTTVSIIIPNRDHSSDLEVCIHSILNKSTYSNYEILIIENGSRESKTFTLYEKLVQYPNIRVIEYHEMQFNYSNINNYAAEHARGQVLLFLNNDTEVISPGWIESMIEHICRPSVGVVGAKLYYPDDTIQHAGVIIGIFGIAGHIYKHQLRESSDNFGRLNLQQNLSAVTAACIMVKRDVFKKVQGFDAGFQLAFGDIDFCLKVRKEGYLVVWTPYAELYHHECKTRGYEDTQEKKTRYNSEFDLFRERWANILTVGDEYYNPNLTLDHLDMSVDPKPHQKQTRITAGAGYQKN